MITEKKSFFVIAKTDSQLFQMTMLNIYKHTKINYKERKARMKVIIGKVWSDKEEKT